MFFDSKRIQIRPWTEADAQAFYELTQDAGFNLFPITVYKQMNHESARSWILNSIELTDTTSFGKCAVWEKVSGALIGMGGLTPWTFDGQEMIDVTYRIRESFWGLGYGLELAETLKKYAFEVKRLTEVTATITPDNHASKKIADKIGMVFDRKIILKGVQTDLYRLKNQKT